MANRPVTAKTAWHDFILDGIEASEITFANDILTVRDYRGKTTKRLASRDIAAIDIEVGFLRNGLTITPKRGQAVKVAGCPASSILAGSCCLTEKCYRNFSIGDPFPPVPFPAVRPAPAV